MKTAKFFIQGFGAVVMEKNLNGQELVLVGLMFTLQINTYALESTGGCTEGGSLPPGGEILGTPLDPGSVGPKPID